MAALKTGELSITADEELRKIGPPQDITSSKLLEYELTIFTDLQTEDGLVITGK